jgi:triosephosphate isomerase
MTIDNKKPFIAGNWKMHKNINEAVELVSSLMEAEKELTEAEVVVIPPFTALSEVKKTLDGSSIKLGAQNLFWEVKGAFTGEISPLMLHDAGCEYVVIGHSERRQYFDETDDTVNKKLKAALAHQLIPIMCIGESLEERKKGETIDKIEHQINSGLEGIFKDDMSRTIMAYEPIWAIGTGLTATPDQAEEVHSFIRNQLEENYGNETASCVIILYGGSVKPDNTYSLIKEKNINGALVGGASLSADSFIQIAKEAVKAYKEKK